MSDGEVDCEDVDCCRQLVCVDSPHCATAPDPLHILLRKQPPSSTSSFYDRVKFLIDDDSVQKYADRNSFEHRSSSNQHSIVACTCPPVWPVASTRVQGWGDEAPKGVGFLAPHRGSGLRRGRFLVWWSRNGMFFGEFRGAKVIAFLFIMVSLSGVRVYSGQFGF